METRLPEKSSGMKGEGLSGTVTPLASHKKLFVDKGIVGDENHGELVCHECHWGNLDGPKNT
jgi:hypothetical protein